MNYRHLYHAGGFTDVLKHVVLLGLITSLLRKEAPFCFIDTHAGNGHYDLLSESAQKTKEFNHGIMKILAGDKPPALVKRYLGCIQKLNARFSHSTFSSLRYYPGSPFIVRPFLRAEDRIIATELQPEEFRTLKANVGYDKQIITQQMDAYQGLKAYLPPKERRGLVLIDPPYEHPDEYKHLLNALGLALKRWETGTYALWYPIKERQQLDRFLKTLKESIHRPMLVTELSLYPEDLPSHLNGCGMLIINPPWKFDQEMNTVLPWLYKTLNLGHQGGSRVYFLRNETECN